MAIQHTPSTADNSCTLSDLQASWVRSLRATNRSQRTIDSYLLALGQLIESVGDKAVSKVTSDDLRAFLSSVLEDTLACQAGGASHRAGSNPATPT